MRYKDCQVQERMQIRFFNWPNKKTATFVTVLQRLFRQKDLDMDGQPLGIGRFANPEVRIIRIQDIRAMTAAVHPRIDRPDRVARSFIDVLSPATIRDTVSV